MRDVGQSVLLSVLKQKMAAGQLLPNFLPYRSSKRKYNIVITLRINYSLIIFTIHNNPVIIIIYGKLQCLILLFKIPVNPLNAELNPICYLLALLGAHRIFHVSGLRIKRERTSSKFLGNLDTHPQKCSPSLY